VVGTGHLAWHLVPNLLKIGLSVELWSRRPVASINLPAPAKPWPRKEPQSLPDAVLLAVPDDQIAAVSERLATLLPRTVAVLHTSGATPLDRITTYFPARGVLWPVYSLRREDEQTDWSTVPLVYAATTEDLQTRLRRWCTALTEHAYALDDEQRAQLHLAAVFGNNFTNWLTQIAFELCTERGIPFAALRPIVQQTFARLDDQAPATRQTGPAARGDAATMTRHLALLEEHPAYARLYRALSQLIEAGKAQNADEK